MTEEDLEARLRKEMVDLADIPLDLMEWVRKELLRQRIQTRFIAGKRRFWIAEGEPLLFKRRVPPF